MSDNLLALDLNGLAHAGPPFLRSLEPGSNGKLDRGGKYRLRQTEQPGGPRPVDLFVILDEPTEEAGCLVGSGALDAVLSHPYSPAAAHDRELRLRLEALLTALRTARCIRVHQHSMPPNELADLVDSSFTNAESDRTDAGTSARRA